MSLARLDAKLLVSSSFWDFATECPGCHEQFVLGNGVVFQIETDEKDGHHLRPLFTCCAECLLVAHPGLGRA